MSTPTGEVTVKIVDGEVVMEIPQTTNYIRFPPAIAGQKGEQMVRMALELQLGKPLEEYVSERRAVVRNEVVTRIFATAKVMVTSLLRQNKAELIHKEVVEYVLKEVA